MLGTPLIDGACEGIDVGHNDTDGASLGIELGCEDGSSLGDDEG